MAYYKTPGPQGVQGPAGPEGPIGPIGEQGVTGVEGKVNYSLIMPEKGLVVTLEDMEIGSDLKPIVTLGVTDPNGLPIDPEDLDGLRFMLAYVDVEETTGQTNYKNYFTRSQTGATYVANGESMEPALASWVNPDRESGGKFTDEGKGVYEYTFGKTLPADYDQSATHILALYAEEGDAISNIIYSFVPDGSEVETTRLISDTET